MKAWPILGILIVQAFLCLAHWFLYFTWIAFWWPLSPAATLALKSALIGLSIIFIVGALLGFRFTNWLVAFIYQIAAVWLGLLNFFFCAAVLAWIIDFVLRFALPGAAHLRVRPEIAGTLFIAAIVAGIYGILNARVIRIRRVPVKLERLPESWRGRTALVMSDLHLGNINGVRFARRITAMAKQLNPDVIFIPGDPSMAPKPVRKKSQPPCSN